MAILGPTLQIADLTQRLSPSLLAELASDLLATMGHSEIKITDGPGDGCRDLHAVNKFGERILAQCKFHQDYSKSVSSKEMGELPLGMVKLGYRKGVFFTNGEVSPQAKREFLNDYKGLELNYLDGRLIIASILENATLRALWFDGEHINNVSNVLIIPVIARNIQIDKPFPITTIEKPDESSELKRLIQERLSQNSVAIDSQGRNSTSLFAPYRLSRVSTVLEGITLDIQVTEFAVSGPLRLDNINTIIDCVTEETAYFIAKNNSMHGAAFCIRIGRPHLTPLSGSMTGVKLPIGITPHTLFCINGQMIEEQEWLLPKDKTSWKIPSHVRASQYSQMRLYSEQLDGCFDYVLISPPGDNARLRMHDQRKAFLWHWERSLFAFLPAHCVADNYRPRLPKASYTIPWTDNNVFLGWLHPHLLRGYYYLPIEDPNDDSENTISDFFRDAHIVATEISELKRVVSLLGAEIVTPERARFIIAAHQGDPLPGQENILYGLGDLLADWDEIPSPIDPMGRKLLLTVCWNLGIKNNQHDEAHSRSLKNNLSDFIETEMIRFEFGIDVDDDTLDKDCYLLLHLREPEEHNSIEMIDERLTRFRDKAKDLIENLEIIIINSFPQAYKATKEYWHREYSMGF